ncbi:hypothetical protein CK203_003953 [Vitis vinifera]|uniref:Uncharacterized protein n=1 Tax=Vitis vinifera TaxID=29760 RepID=A0A438K951_VITVI|nr:hypothetical protein CK203_068735 [Vitis vinifera]RVX17723.1 hypothetical protein CK203_003953 [Vitis vinifera]
MGNCCSDDGGGRSAVGGTSASQHDHNDAVDLFLKSRGYRGLFVQIEESLFFKCNSSGWSAEILEMRGGGNQNR